MNGESIKVLLIEDNSGDARLIQEMLAEVSAPFCLERTERLSAGLERLAKGSIGVVLLDLGLPDSWGLDTFLKTHSQAPQVPIIVLTGLFDEEWGLKAVREGAQDYLVKAQVDGNLLTRAIRYAIERKRAEEALRKSEIRYRNLVEDTVAGIVIIDSEGRFVYFNRAFCRMTGYTDEEMLGKPLANLLHSDDKKRVMLQFQKALTQPGDKPGLEFRMIHKNGHIVHMYSSPTALEYEGKMAGFSAIITDITERKRVEYDLGKRVQELRCLYSVASVTETPGVTSDEVYREVVKLLPPGWQYPEITCARIAINGDEFQTKNWEDNEWKQCADISVNGTKRGVVEVSYLAAKPQIDEGPFLKEERLLIDAIADRLGQNIERKQTEALSTTLVSGSPLGIYIVQDGKFVFVNPQLQETIDYSEDELLGTDPLSYVFPGDRDVVRTGAVLMLKGKLFTPYEYRIINKGGQLRWVMETVASIRYQGRPATLGNCMDINERKLLEKKMVEYEELDRLKSDLLSTVSHELRTPLATIKGYSTMILDYDRRLSSKEKNEYLQSIDRATDRLTGLVNRLLDMSQLDAGLMKMDRVSLNISRLIKEAVAEGQLRAPAHKIKLEIRNGLPRLTIDARRIREVLDNLLDNACKYSAEGTEVVVSARRVGRQLLISVTDQGVGIPADEVERVFDRMYRIEQRLTSKVEGMGLGLAICKGLVEAHGGRIWMVSEEGKGSKCSFTLPIGNKG